MNYIVYVDGVHLSRVDTQITEDDHLWLRQAPAAGSQVVIQIVDGWKQGFAADGFTNRFPLSQRILDSVQSPHKWLEYKQTLHEVMRHLDNETVRAEVDRLATVLAMIRDYDSNKSRI